MFSRTDKSLVGKWWWTIDRWNLTAILLLMFIGSILIFSASPSMALRLENISSYHFITKHLTFLLISVCILFCSSIMMPKNILKVSLLIFVLSLILTIFTLIFGQEIKGSRRWLQLGELSMQPAEFLKPAFVIVTAWLFSLDFRKNNHIAGWLSFILLAVLIFIIAKQPDNGMVVILFCVWSIQLIVSGVSIRIIISLFILFLTLIGLLYLASANVQHRIHSYLDPSVGDRFQIEKSREAFERGGMLGVGPGEGSVKEDIPDVHTDFILAIAGEEYGVVACLLIVSIFVFIVIRGSILVRKSKNLFVILSVSGLLGQLGLQAFINIASTLHMIPTKGMTLPFVSYGGSSLIAMSLGMGIMLCLTKKRIEEEDLF